MEYNGYLIEINKTGHGTKHDLYNFFLDGEIYSGSGESIDDCKTQINEILNLTIYNEDCQDTLFLRKLNFDYVFTSPPYNLGGDFHTFIKGKRVTYGDYDGFSDNLPEKEYQEQQISVLNQLYNGLSEDGICFYNHKIRIKNRKIIHPLEWINKTKFNIYQIVTIDFGSTPNVDKSRFFPVSELMFILTKKQEPLIINKSCLTDIVKIKKGGRKKGHPATFSENMVETFLNTVKIKGLVYDPYIGTGTTAIASNKLGFTCIGSEVSRKTYDLCKNNIKTNFNI
jgi:modification methylase